MASAAGVALGGWPGAGDRAGCHHACPAALLSAAVLACTRRSAHLFHLTGCPGCVLVLSAPAGNAGVVSAACCVPHARPKAAPQRRHHDRLAVGLRAPHALPRLLLLGRAASRQLEPSWLMAGTAHLSPTHGKPKLPPHTPPTAGNTGRQAAGKATRRLTFCRSARDTSTTRPFRPSEAICGRSARAAAQST